MSGVVVCELRGEKSNSRGDGKAGVWCTDVCWACRERGRSVTRVSRLVPTPHPTPAPGLCSQRSLVIVLFWEQALCLNTFRRLWGGSKAHFLSLNFLQKNQPEEILLPKRHILWWQILLPDSNTRDAFRMAPCRSLRPRSHNLLVMADT